MAQALPHPRRGLSNYIWGQLTKPQAVCTPGVDDCHSLGSHKSPVLYTHNLGTHKVLEKHVFFSSFCRDKISAESG